MVMIFITLRQFGHDYAKRLGHVAALFILVLGLVMACNYNRAIELIAKTIDMVQNAESLGGRDGIWATSRAMFKMHPLWGVGIGQYKWHYLEAQREMLAAHPEKVWQYTHWAHNEFLQWFCESGIVGGAFLTAMWGLWVISLLVMLWRRERVSAEVIWACALISLISFNALWTRPFHRIENILWLALAFALSNRDMAVTLSSRMAFQLENLTRACGAVLLAASLGGLYYLGDGMVGDRTIREALSTQNANLQRTLLERASRRLMVENEAKKNLGYHYVQLGEHTQDYQTLWRGFNLLWQHFQREPHSEELRVLLELSQRFQNLDILRELASYLKPGTFRLEEQTALDSGGSVVSATILIPLQESGGMKIVAPPSDENSDENDDENPDIQG
jgi:hypothetical protein